MSARTVLVAVWLGGVLLATAGGLLAVRLVADQVGDPPVPVLDRKDVTTALQTPTARPSAPATATRPTTTGGASAVRSFSSSGGSVGVRCRGTVPERVYATPAQGYRLDESEVEGSALEVRFTSSSTRVRVEVGCGSGRPVLLERRADEAGGKG